MCTTVRMCHVLFVKRTDYTGDDVTLLCFICNHQMATFFAHATLSSYPCTGKKKIVLHKYYSVNALLANFAQSYTERRSDILQSVLHCDEVTLSQGNSCRIVRMYFWQASEPIRQPHTWLSCSSTCLFFLERFCLLCWDLHTGWHDRGILTCLRSGL